jgi:hypothetical protein
MRTIHHTARAADKTLHVEAEGVLVNIQVGLSDDEGRRVTRVDISPDDATRGGRWYQDGARIVELLPGENPPTTRDLHDLLVAARRTRDEIEHEISQDEDGDDGVLQDNHASIKTVEALLGYLTGGYEPAAGTLIEHIVNLAARAS